MFVKGHIVSAETRKKLRYWLGKKYTKEQRFNLSVAHLGQVPWNKGKTLSAEIRAKFSLAHKGKKNTPEVEERRIRAMVRGEQHWNWKGGLTAETTRLKTSQQWRFWRLSVFERDDYTCQKCHIKGGTLNPHHILNRADHQETWFDLENGITLCKRDHTAFHRQYGRRKNTREQLLEFLDACEPLAA